MVTPSRARRRYEGTAASGSRNEKFRSIPAMKFKQNKADLVGSFGGFIKVRRLLLGILAVSGSLYGSTIAVTDASVFAATKDIVYWQQLGQDTNGSSFFVYTALNEQIHGSLDNGTGTIVTVGNQDAPAAGGGFNKGDALLSTDDGSGTGSAPLTIGFNTPMYGVGAYIEGAGGGQFSATIQAFSGVTSILNTTMTSDAAGDPMFLGASSAAGQITSIIVSLKTGLSPENFVISKLYVQDQPFAAIVAQPIIILAPAAPADAPEPGMAALSTLGLAFLAFLWKRRSVRA
jgi:hypothetical protein